MQRRAKTEREDKGMRRHERHEREKEKESERKRCAFFSRAPVVSHLTLTMGRWLNVLGAACWRRERRLRSMLRHQRQTVVMELAMALHHSCDVEPDEQRTKCTRTEYRQRWRENGQESRKIEHPSRRGRWCLRASRGRRSSSLQGHTPQAFLAGQRGRRSYAEERSPRADECSASWSRSRPCPSLKPTSRSSKFE